MRMAINMFLQNEHLTKFSKDTKVVGEMGGRGHPKLFKMDGWGWLALGHVMLSTNTASATQVLWITELPYKINSYHNKSFNSSCIENVVRDYMQAGPIDCPIKQILIQYRCWFEQFEYDSNNKIKIFAVIDMFVISHVENIVVIYKMTTVQSWSIPVKNTSL